VKDGFPRREVESWRAPLKPRTIGTDTRSMAVAVVEPISPELALVCPELRKRAIASLPDVAWRAFVQEVVRTAPESVEPTRWETVRTSAATALLSPLLPLLALPLCVVALTLILTLIADATR
jgi:hypothetical protein